MEYFILKKEKQAEEFLEELEVRMAELQRDSALAAIRHAKPKIPKEDRAVQAGGKEMAAIIENQIKDLEHKVKHFKTVVDAMRIEEERLLK